MSLQSSYNSLVIKVDTYLRKRREDGKWERHLPESIFDPQLWLWDRRSMRIGAAWGAAFALAPLPLQSFFAIMACIVSRGNVPVGILACWISIPGYQLIAWPLQWALGSWCCLACLGWHSGASVELVQHAATLAPQGWTAVMDCLTQVDLTLFLLEFIIGCALSSSLIWLFFYYLVGMLVPAQPRKDA